MTRFMITVEEGVALVWHALGDLVGGEIYVRKSPSMKVVDIARAIAPGARQDFVGMRPGEKLHEQMIGPEDAPHTYEYPGHYKILPAIHGWSMDPDRISDGVKCPEGFTYGSEGNTQWMDVDFLRDWIEKNRAMIGKI
jgi:FlaA1/EpsC-like NDP-sugar epimerase